MSLLQDHIALIGPESEAARRAFGDLLGGPTNTRCFADMAAFSAAAQDGTLIVHCAVVTGATTWDDCRTLRSDVHACAGLADVPVILHVDSEVLTDLDGWDRHTTITWHQMDPIVIRSIVLGAANQYRRMQALKQEGDERAHAIGLLGEGQFTLRTPEEARRLAALLSQAGPDPDRVSVGLLELFMNAIEHGNLGLGYDGKTELIESGDYNQTLEALLKHPDNRLKQVQVQVRRLADAIEFDIEDEGDGFDSEPFLTFDPDRAMASHGRGIASAKMLFFDDVTYIGAGNRVIARKFLPSHPKKREAEQSVPASSGQEATQSA